MQGTIKELQADQAIDWKNSRCVTSSLTHFEKVVPHSEYSIKLVLKGEEKYLIEGSHYSLKAGEFLIVNQGEQIETHISSQSTTEGICIYPSAELLGDVFQGVCTDALSTETKPSSINLTTRAHRLQSNSLTATFLSTSALQLHQYEHTNPDWWNSFYLKLAESLACDQSILNQKLNRVKSAKKQTKEELYRRVKKAYDYIQDNKTEQLNLEALCQLSAMSKYHFLRSFKAIFNQTPYQYLLNLKLTEAKVWLAKDYSYEETSQLIGFSGGRNLRKALKKDEV